MLERLQNKYRLVHNDTTGLSAFWQFSIRVAGYNSGDNMKARVYVTMKPSVLDAQGQAVRTALRSMGHSMVQDVRQGKYFELDLQATDRTAAAAELEQISHEILSNPVIEQYRVEILD